MKIKTCHLKKTILSFLLCYAIVSSGISVFAINDFQSELINERSLENNAILQEDTVVITDENEPEIVVEIDDEKENPIQNDLINERRLENNGILPEDKVVIIYENEPEIVVGTYDENGNPIQDPINNLTIGRTGKVYPQYTYGEKLVDTDYKTKYNMLCSGQLPGGYSYPKGGGRYIDDDGGSPISVSFALAYRMCSISITPGSDASRGSYVPFPANNKYYVVKSDKTYKLKTYRIDYSFNHGREKFTCYETRSSLYSASFYPVRA